MATVVQTDGSIDANAAQNIMGKITKGMEQRHKLDSAGPKAQTAAAPHSVHAEQMQHLSRASEARPQSMLTP